MAIDENILENLDNLSQEEVIEVAKQAVDEFKTLQSSTTKGLNLVDQAITFYKNTWGDLEKLKELKETNPEIASIVIKKFYDGSDIDEIQENLQKKEEDLKMSDQVQSIINSYKDQIPEEMKEKFDQEFTEFVWQRKLTPENVEKYIKASLRELWSSVDTKVIEDARLASAWWASSSPKKNNKEEALLNDAKKLLKESRN